MKTTLVILAAILSFSVSAKSLTCTASLSSQKEEEKSLEAALNWMEINQVTDFEQVPESFNSRPVKVDTRSVKLDSDGNAELPGIIIESYEKHGISYNYAAYAKNGFITYVGAENEVAHNGSGVKNLKNQTEVEYGTSSTVEGSTLDIICSIK